MISDGIVRKTLDISDFEDDLIIEEMSSYKTFSHVSGSELNIENWISVTINLTDEEDDLILSSSDLEIIDDAYNAIKTGRYKEFEKVE